MLAGPRGPGRRLVKRVSNSNSQVVSCLCLVSVTRDRSGDLSSPTARSFDCRAPFLRRYSWRVTLAPTGDLQRSTSRSASFFSGHARLDQGLDRSPCPISDTTMIGDQSGRGGRRRVASHRTKTSRVKTFRATCLCPPFSSPSPFSFGASSIYRVLGMNILAFWELTERRLLRSTTTHWWRRLLRSFRTRTREREAFAVFQGIGMKSVLAVTKGSG